jgi:CHAT domain-containing protein
VISTLWPVADAGAAAMVQGLLAEPGRSIAERMRATALNSLATSRRDPDSEDPLTWAAFIATGAWDD